MWISRNLFKFQEIMTYMDPKAEAAAELAKSFIDSRHGNVEMLSFEIESVAPAKEEHVWIVKCSLYPKIGWTERVHYDAMVNLKTEQVDLEQTG